MKLPLLFLLVKMTFGLYNFTLKGMLSVRLVKVSHSNKIRKNSLINEKNKVNYFSSVKIDIVVVQFLKEKDVLYNKVCTLQSASIYLIIL